MTSAALTAAVARRPLAWRDVLVLLKLRIDALIVAVALAAAVAAGQRDVRTLLVLAAAALASSGGASALNHYLDRDLDARMERTAGRPLPSGRLSPRFALTLGLSLVAASQLALPVLGAAASVYLLAGAAVYAVVYTLWLKRRTPHSVVWGGAAGSFAALAGWQTAATTVAVAPLLFALVLFLWTPSHFWSFAIAKERDYGAARVPTLTAVLGVERTARVVLWNTTALVAASLALAPFVGWPYALLAVPAGAWFVALAARLAREPSQARAWSVFKLSGAYLLVVLAALLLTTLA